jgi:hypothetical protein
VTPSSWHSSPTLVSRLAPEYLCPDNAMKPACQLRRALCDGSRFVEALVLLQPYRGSIFAFSAARSWHRMILVPFMSENGGVTAEAS